MDATHDEPRVRRDGGRLRDGYHRFGRRIDTFGWT
jgi:hypothetical protein